MFEEPHWDTNMLLQHCVSTHTHMHTHKHIHTHIQLRSIFYISESQPFSRALLTNPKQIWSNQHKPKLKSQNPHWKTATPSLQT